MILLGYVSGTILAAVLYVGSLAFWPIYRIRQRGRKPLTSLFVIFLIHLTLFLVWTAMEVRYAYYGDGDDWLHGLVVYILLNVVFLIAYLVALKKGNRSRSALLPS